MRSKRRLETLFRHQMYHFYQKKGRRPTTRPSNSYRLARLISSSEEEAQIIIIIIFSEEEEYETTHTDEKKRSTFRKL